MKELCIDANIAVKFVVSGEKNREEARHLLHYSLTKRILLIAPPFFQYEIDSAIIKRVRSGEFDMLAAERAFIGLDKLPVRIISTNDLKSYARKIALKFKQKYIYDSTYAALAQIRKCDFWTADKKFYDDVKDKLKFVKLLGESKLV